MALADTEPALTDHDTWDAEHPSARTHSRYLIDRLLDQNERLIELLGEAVRTSSPTSIISALNPPYVPSVPETSQDPWRTDTAPEKAREDPWGDESIPLERLVPGRGGFVPGPNTPEPPSAADLSPVVANGGGDDGGTEGQPAA